MCEPVCLTNCQVLKYKPQHIGVGQNADWKSCHKKICKSYNKYTASPSYQALAQNEKLDALLLSHLVSKLFSSSDIGPMDLLVEDEPTPFSTFSSLLASPATNQATPPICPMGKLDVLMDGVLDELFSRFGNNNFAIHSHLVSIAHGIFPLASRLFNHSCVPNAVARYVLEKSKPPCMEVVALRTIQEGDEVSERPCPVITFQFKNPQDLYPISRPGPLSNPPTDLQRYLRLYVHMLIVHLRPKLGANQIPPTSAPGLRCSRCVDKFTSQVCIFFRRLFAPRRSS